MHLLAEEVGRLKRVNGERLRARFIERYESYLEQLIDQPRLADSERDQITRSIDHTESLYPEFDASAIRERLEETSSRWH